MDELQEALASFNSKSKPKENTKKRKWREIEQLREKFQLEKELKVYDYSLDDY